MMLKRVCSSHELHSPAGISASAGVSAAAGAAAAAAGRATASTLQSHLALAPWFVLNLTGNPILVQPPHQLQTAPLAGLTACHFLPAAFMAARQVSSSSIGEEPSGQPSTPSLPAMKSDPNSNPSHELSLPSHAQSGKAITLPAIAATRKIILLAERL